MLANLEYYKVYYYAVKCGTVTGAAQALSLSQPAVSQSLKQLESVLGVRLLRRTPRGIVPTAEGRLLYSYVEKGCALFETGEKRLMQMRSLEEGEIAIGASDMTLRFFLLPWLERFHDAYPGIKVSVTNGPTPSTMQLLREGKIDFCVVSGPVLKEQGIRTEPVKKIEDIFVAGAKYGLYRDGPWPLQILETLPLIMLDRTTSTRKYVQHFLEDNGVHVMPEFELATSDMIVQFAMRNLGVGSVVREFAQEALQNGELIELSFDVRMPERDFYVVTEEKNHASLAAERLLEMILSGLEEKRNDKDHHF